MGFLDSLLGDEKKSAASVQAKEFNSDKSTNPFAVSMGFSPLRLSAKSQSTVNLLVKVKNVSNSSQLVSVDVLLPKDCMIGFDPACINKAIEKRAGELKAGDTVEVSIPVWSNNQTKDGTYRVDVSVFAHYIGYDKVLSYIKKSTTLRVS